MPEKAQYLKKKLEDYLRETDAKISTLIPGISWA